MVYNTYQDRGREGGSEGGAQITQPLFLYK